MFCNVALPPTSPVLRNPSRVLGDSSQQPRADFLIVVKGEDDVWLVSLGQGAMRARLAFDRLTPTQQARMRRAFVAGQLPTLRGRVTCPSGTRKKPVRSAKDT